VLSIYPAQPVEVRTVSLVLRMVADEFVGSIPSLVLWIQYVIVIGV
jgi:hypothetical protein